MVAPDTGMGALLLAGSLRELIASTPVVTESGEISVSISIGVSCLLSDGCREMKECRLKPMPRFMWPNCQAATVWPTRWAPCLRVRWRRRDVRFDGSGIAASARLSSATRGNWPRAGLEC